MESILETTAPKEVEYLATENDFVKAALLQGSLISPRIRIYFVIFTLLMGWRLIHNGTNFVADIGPFIQFFVTISLFVFLMKFFVIPRGAKKVFAQSPLVHRPQLLTILSNRLLVKNDNGEFKFLWTDFVSWKSNQFTTLLFTNPTFYIIVPSRLSEQGLDIAMMHTGLTAAIGPAK